MTEEVFKTLEDNIKNNKTENGEFQITSTLDMVREKDGMIAFIPDGEMADIENIESYKKALAKSITK